MKLKPGKIIFLMLFIVSGLLAQQIEFIDTTVFITGAGDTTFWKNLEGRYSYVYIVIDDTGSTYTDSVKAWSITKRKTTSDSVISPIDIRGRAGTVPYQDHIATSNAGVITKYLLIDAWIDRLLLTWGNITFVNAKRVKITILGVRR